MVRNHPARLTFIPGPLWTKTMRRLIKFFFCKVSNWWDLVLGFPDCFKIWQASRQQSCRAACQISRQYEEKNMQSCCLNIAEILWRDIHCLNEKRPRSAHVVRDLSQWPQQDDSLTHWGRENDCHFADDTFKRIFLKENVRMSIKISLKFVPKSPIDNIPALFQIMAWRRLGDKPLSEPMMVRLSTHICVSRPQWVNTKLSILANTLALYRAFKMLRLQTFTQKLTE